MTKITVNPPTRVKTPTEEVLDEAGKIVQVQDAKGRMLGIRRIDTSLRRRVFKTISAENQAKEQYLGLVMISASVCQINGEDVRFPTSEMQFDALIDRLDDAGMEAASEALRDHFMPDQDIMSEAKN